MPDELIGNGETGGPLAFSEHELEVREVRSRERQPGDRQITVDARGREEQLALLNPSTRLRPRSSTG